MGRGGGLPPRCPRPRWFWLRGSQAAAPDSERLSRAAAQGRGEARGGGSSRPAAGERRCPAELPQLPAAAGAQPRWVGAGCSSREFRNPRGAAGVSSPGVAARPGPAPAPRSAFTPPARELVRVFLQTRFVSSQRQL